MRLLTRSSARHLLGHRTQLVLSVLGVALGVAVVLSIDLAIASARAAFRVSAETVSGRATHQIAGEVADVDELLLARLRTEVGVVSSAPVVEGYASSARLAGQALRIVGVDPFSEAPFRPFVAGGPTGVDVSAFLTTAGGVVLAASTAERAGVAPGDTLQVRVAGRSRGLPVVGVVEPADELARTGLADVLLMDVSGAQDLLGMVGRLSRIDLVLPEGDRGEALRARIRALLPPELEVTPAGTRTAAMSGMIAAFDLNLTALSLLALIFGMFLIYNAMTFSVVQRRDLLGRLRAVGVTRGEVLRLIVREAAWIGMAGALLGIAVGALLARGLVRLVTRTINDLYFSVTVEGVALEPAVLAKAAALGVGATLLAALPPALEAAAARPRLATLRSVSETKARRLVPRAATAGVALASGGALLLAVSGRSLGLSFAALFLVITGLALVTPAGTVALVALARPLVGRVGGSLGLVACRGVVAALSRTAPAIAALVVAVSVTVGLGVMIASFRGTLERWLDATLRADVYVSLPGPGASRASGTLPPALVEAFVGHPEVVGRSTYRGVDVLEDAGAYHLIALDLDPRGIAAFDFLAGDATSIMAAFGRGDGVIVSEPFAFRRGLAPGDPFELSAESGPVRLPVLGVFRDYGSDRGTVMIARSAYDGLFGDPGVTSLGLFLSETADSEAVVRDLLAAVPEGLTVVARTNDTLRAASLDVFDRTFEVTAVLRLLAFIVAFVGVLSALMALQLERARELGVLRASGLTPGQLWKLVTTQTGLMGLIAGVLAVPMGLVLSVVMIFVINRRSFGWTLEMQVGPDVLVQAVGLALGGALVAGIYPAWRMARTPPALALRAVLVLTMLGAGCGGEPPGTADRARLSLVETLAGADTAGYERAFEPRPFDFPNDHGPHPGFRTEWWYVTGNLEARDGRDFGFQLTIFRSALAPRGPRTESAWGTSQAYMAHFTVTDVAAGRFHVFERFARGAVGLAGATADPLRVWVGDWAITGTSVQDEGGPSRSFERRTTSSFPLRLHASDDGVVLDLELERGKSHVPQGEAGLSRKGPEPGNASYYYSLTRMPAAGTLVLAGDTALVRGSAWLDREWSTSALGPGQVGWDWFALQLDDGHELMIYRLRRADGTADAFSDGVLVAPSGEPVRLEWGSDVRLEATGTWRSPIDGAAYPSGWRILLPERGWALEVEPVLVDQELDVAFRYWEGAVRMRGTGEGGESVTGVGYVELTGYAGEPPER